MQYSYYFSPAKYKIVIII